MTAEPRFDPPPTPDLILAPHCPAFAQPGARYPWCTVCGRDQAERPPKAP